MDSNAGATLEESTRKAKGGGPKKRSRSNVLEPLRAKLQADAAAGNVKDTRHYLNWVLDQDKNIGLKQAKTMVYRERRAVA